MSVGTNPALFEKVLEASRYYDLAFACESVPTSSQVIGRFLAVRPFTLPASLSGSLAKAGVAATAETIFDIQVNGVSKGSLTFAASGTTGTFTFASAVAISAGDVISIIGPASADSTIASIAISLVGNL